jgi:hypothetical protein
MANGSENLTSIIHPLLPFTGSSFYKAEEVNSRRRCIIHLFLQYFIPETTHWISMESGTSALNVVGLN